MKKVRGRHPYEAIEKYPHLSVYDAIEISKPRTHMLGLRITEEEKSILTALGKEKGITATQIAYLLLRKRLIEFHFNTMPPTRRQTTNRDEIVPEEMRWRVLERDDFRCKKCSSRHFLHVDHIHPRSKGGKAVMSNLQTLCRKHNSQKKDKLP